jgi:hypothetical protein
MSLIAFISSSSIIAQVMLFAHLRFAKISGLISELGGALGLMKTMPEALGAESSRTTKRKFLQVGNERSTSWVTLFLV